MEFKEKLQELRKKKGLTQEELAAHLYVSRAAISKWESGRGYPNLDSLKAMAEFFSISIDELLSGGEVVSVAEEENKQTKTRISCWIFALLDCSVFLFFILPIFGQKSTDGVYTVSLLSMTIAPYLKAVYLIAVGAILLWGVLAVVLHICRPTQWILLKRTVSVILNLIGIVLFIISPQPYAALLLLVILGIKLMIR